MQKCNLLVGKYPYDEMLKALASVKGYEQFTNFIKERALQRNRRKSNDWKAEVKALFEINKKAHPLVEICSHMESEPEGIFKIDNELGIIEAAFVRYLFTGSDIKRKLYNWTLNKLVS